MRVVFMGTPQYAVTTLDALVDNNYDVVAVYTRADAPSGRGKKLYPSDVKARALELGLEVFTPSTLRDPDVIAQIASFEPDAIVVAAYGMILPKEVIDIPTMGTYNVHASMLPRWRGAAPIQRAILSGDSHVGVCTMKVVEELDAGEYIPTSQVRIGDKSMDRLTFELSRLGAAGMLETLAAESVGCAHWLRQDEECVTYAKKVAKKEILLSPELPAFVAKRRIQASNHRAPARCVVCGTELTVVAAHPAEENVAAGQVLLDKKRVVLGFPDGALEVDTVKPKGKKEMPVANWVCGLHDPDLTWTAV